MSLILTNPTPATGTITLNGTANQKASGNFVLTGLNPGLEIQINGQAMDAVASDPTVGEFVVGATDQESAINLAIALNDPLTNGLYGVDAVASDNIVFVTAFLAGAGGNSITLLGNGNMVTPNATLIGGADADVTIDGNTYTAVFSGPSARQYQMGATDADTASNLAAHIEYLDDTSCHAVALGNVVTLTSEILGAAANAITLVGSDTITVSGANLEGGGAEMVITAPPKQPLINAAGIYSTDSFDIGDSSDPTKQLAFDLSAMPTDTTNTMAMGTAGGVTLTWPNVSGTILVTPEAASDDFGIIDVPNGTNPAAGVPHDTLTMASGDNSVVITGDSGTNSLDLVVDPSVISHSGLANLVSPADDHTQYALLGGRSGGQALYGDTVSPGGGTLSLLGDPHAGSAYITLDGSVSPDGGQVLVSGGSGNGGGQNGGDGVLAGGSPVNGANWGAAFMRGRRLFFQSGDSPAEVARFDNAGQFVIGDTVAHNLLDVNGGTRLRSVANNYGFAVVADVNGDLSFNSGGLNAFQFHFQNEVLTDTSVSPGTSAGNRFAGGMTNGGSTTEVTANPVGGKGASAFVQGGQGGHAPNATVLATGGDGGDWADNAGGGGRGGSTTVDNRGGAGGYRKIAGGAGGVANNATPGTNTAGAGGPCYAYGGQGGGASGGGVNVDGNGGDLFLGAGLRGGATAIGGSTFLQYAGGASYQTACSLDNTGAFTYPLLTASHGLALDGSNKLVSLSATNTELNYSSGVTSAIQTQLNNKQASGNYITALTGDVTATGPGSVAGTVAAVGGSTAANVHAAELLANAATSANTANAIVKRGASGQIVTGNHTFAAGTGLTIPVTGGAAYAGTATLNGATGVTVSTTSVKADSLIFVSVQNPAGTQGLTPYAATADIVAGTSFKIKGTALDLSTVNWLIINVS